MKNYADRGGCYRACLEDKGLFRSANILQVADAVCRVVFNKKIFRPFGPPFGLKIREGLGPWAPPLDSPLP